MLRRLGLLALLGIALLGAAAGWLDSQLDRSYRGKSPDKVFVEIPHGTPRWKIARILRDAGVIRSAPAFTVFSEWHFRKPLQAGEYLFDRPVNSRQVFWKIERGQIFVHVVTVPEGWTSTTLPRKWRGREFAAGKSFWPRRGTRPSYRISPPECTRSKVFFFLLPMNSRDARTAGRLRIR